MKQRKSIYDVNVISFRAATTWIKRQGAEVEMHSLGGRTKTKYFASVFDGCILLHYQAKYTHEYILRKEEWMDFMKFYKKNEHTARVLGKHYKEWGCHEKSFWPCVLVISKAYIDSRV